MKRDGNFPLHAERIIYCMARANINNVFSPILRNPWSPTIFFLPYSPMGLPLSIARIEPSPLCTE